MRNINGYVSCPEFFFNIIQHDPASACIVPYHRWLPHTIQQHADHSNQIIKHDAAPQHRASPRTIMHYSATLSVIQHHLAPLSKLQFHFYQRATPGPLITFLHHTSSWHTNTQLTEPRSATQLCDIKNSKRLLFLTHRELIWWDQTKIIS